MLRRGAVIVGFGETPLSRENSILEQNVGEVLTRASKSALDNAGLNKSDITGLALAGSRSPHAEIYSAEIVEDLGISPEWVIRSDHGGASSLIMLMQAVIAIESGQVDTVLCLGGRSVRWDFRDTGYVRDFEAPFGMMGANSHFALIMRRYMHEYGVRPEHTGKISVTQRYHASLNPAAYLRKQITIDDYMKSRLICDPLRLLDACISVNGGAAFILTSTEKARKLTDTPIRIDGFGYRCNSFEGERYSGEMTEMGGMRAAMSDAFKMADAKPDDLSFLQLYDDYTIAVLMQLECLGLCEKPQIARFVDESDFTFKGDFPLNTGGGMLSAGQISTGFIHLIEAIKQLQNKAENRQVPDAKCGIVTGLGGISHLANIINHVAVIVSV